MEDFNELRAKRTDAQEETELETQVEELANLLGNSPLPVHCADSTGRIIWANQAELDLLGYAKHEYIGYLLHNFYAESAVASDFLNRLLNNETLRNFPAILKCKNGDLKQVIIDADACVKNGKVINTRCFTKDITFLIERKDARLFELEESEARLKMVIKSASLGTWDYNPLSGELNWSEECKHIYGLPPGTAINFDVFSDLIYAEDMDLALGAIKKAMDPEGGGNYDITYRILRFDDRSVRWIRAQGRVYFNDQLQAIRFIGTVIDITDNKVAQEKIASNEKLFKSIALNIPKSLIIVIDKDHKLIAIEGDAIAKLGYGDINYQGKHISEIVPEDRYEAVKPLYNRMLAGEKFSTERKAQNGEDYMVHLVPLKHDNDEVYAGLIIALDITDIKQAEEKSAKLAAIVESSDDAIISKTLDGIITSWNHSAQRIFGYTAEEMIGQPILKIIPDDRLNEEPQIIRRLKAGERVEHFETKRITKDKRLIDISLTISAVKNSQGHIIGASKIARDISEQKQAGRIISESEEHLRLAIKAADMGTFDMDLVKGTMEWDIRCRELFGIFESHPVTYNHDFLNGLHEDDRERVNSIIDKVLDKNQSDGVYDVEYRTVGVEDRKIRWVRAMGQAFFDENDKPLRFVGTVLDITDRKKEELRKNDFIAIVSHELKTPLTSIKSYVQVLLNMAKKEGDTFKTNALTRTESQANKMAFMIQDFLSLARLEEGKIQLTKEWFDLDVLIEEVVADAQIFTTIHNIRATTCKVNIYADRDKISRVLMNLLTNAIKYSPSGGTVSIACNLTNDTVKISVTDEGVGIKMTDQKRLFDRFYRVKNEKIKTVSGFGIGLYLVSEILRYHNSKIEVESKEGIGSVFFFSLALK